MFIILIKSGGRFMKKLLALALALCLALSLGITAAHADGVGGTQYPNPL